MFRAALLFLGCLLLGAAAIGVVAGAPWGFIIWAAILGAMLVAGVLFERGRYRPAAPGHPGPGWEATGERFIDPESGEQVTVIISRRAASGATSDDSGPNLTLGARFNGPFAAPKQTFGVNSVNLA